MDKTLFISPRTLQYGHTNRKTKRSSSRTLVSALLAMMLVGSWSYPIAWASQCVAVPPERIGAQLYNFRDEFLLRTPDGQSQRLPPSADYDLLMDTFEALAQIGYEYVELFGGSLNLAPSAYPVLATKQGISVISGHHPLSLDDWQDTLKDAKEMGQVYVGSGGFGEPGIESLTDTLVTAANLNRLGKLAAHNGLKFFVHNHVDEFTTQFPYDPEGLEQQKVMSAWEIVAANTDPRYVSFELDIHWARVAFGIDRFDDLLSFLRRYRDRIVILHVKDTAQDGTIADLGRGTTNWPAIFEAAGPQIRYYFWEHDNSPDVRTSALDAYKFLRCQE